MFCCFCLDCLEPDTRVVARWKNGNYYKGVVESLTNVISVLFDNGNRLNFNLHNKYDILEDRIPEESEVNTSVYISQTAWSEQAKPCKYLLALQSLSHPQKIGTNVLSTSLFLKINTRKRFVDNYN